MLIEFKIGNFLSFKDIQIFSMVASNGLTDIPNNKIEIEKNNFYLLKSASIFGANASGKSNLLAGINFMRNFIVNSFKNSNDSDEIANITFSLNPESQKGNSFFEITALNNKKLIRYGFEISKYKVQKEWLFIEEELIYNRENDTLNSVNSDYLAKDVSSLTWKMTNDKSLYLSILASTNMEFAKEILVYFKDSINTIHCLGGGSSRFTKKLIENNKNMTNRIVNMLKVADFSITNMTIKKRGYEVSNRDKEELPEEILAQIEADSNRLMTEHNVYDDEGNIVGMHKFDSEMYESSGTNEFLKLAGPLLDTLENGNTLFIDEIDAQFHPLMTQYILGLFNSATNKNNAQLIITSHNSTILDNKLMRRDQIWFAEKDSLESSHLTSLANYRFKGEVVRKDEKYAKNYLNGKYGAIPLIKKDFNDFFTEEE